jgi:hypothetical protein
MRGVCPWSTGAPVRVGPSLMPDSSTKMIGLVSRWTFFKCELNAAFAAVKAILIPLDGHDLHCHSSRAPKFPQVA